MTEQQPPLPQTFQGTVDWLKSILEDPENEDTDFDSIMDSVIANEWSSDDEFLSFFRFISIELARTACKSPNEETAELFGRPIYYGLSLGSPYYQLWEKAFLLKSPVLHESISTEDWEVDLDSGIEEIDLIGLIPLATAYELPIFEQLRNRSITELDEPREEFLGYLAAMLGVGYYDGTLPVEILNIPSSKICCELLEDWTQYRDLWQPEVLESFLESDTADETAKGLIRKVLSGEDEVDPEAWEEQLEEYWTEEDVERLSSLCV
jgi:hypothetical protein